MVRDLKTPLTAEVVRTLKCGEHLTISGTIYTARDAAHKRLVELIAKGGEPPIPLADSILYYTGPTPAREGQAIGSAGPTTSERMDAYSPTLLAAGNRGMIGKGKRNQEVIEAIKRYGGVYFGAVGGAGALLSKCIKSAEIVAYEDLGAEAIFCLEVEKFPVVVVIDSEGQNLYETSRTEYLKATTSTLQGRP